MQHRGQPSTHDIDLGTNLFEKLARGLPVKIPQYDKSRHDGEGDRVEECLWEEVNIKGQGIIQVVILEGWCVGFRPLHPDEVQEKWENAVREIETGPDQYRGRLGWNRIEDILFINKSLDEYEKITRSVHEL